MDLEQEKLLDWVLVALFPDPEEREKARKLLEGYGAEEFHREASRVRVAVLKLAGRDLERIEYYTGHACIDYRDVLAMAEYPEQLRHSFPEKTDPEGYARIMENDRRQYEMWIEQVLKGGRG